MVSLAVQVGGKPATVVSRETIDSPHRVLLVLDASGSMAGRGSDTRKITAEWAGTLRIARSIVEGLPAQDEVALVVFSDDISKEASFELRRPDLLQQLAELEFHPPHGRTALLDALGRATQLFGQGHPGDTIIVISDGGDNRSRSTAGVMERNLLLRGIRVFALAFDDQDPRTPEERAGVPMLQELSTVTGGDAIAVSRLTEVPPAVVQLLTTMVSRVVLVTNSLVDTDFTMDRVTIQVREG